MSSISDNLNKLMQQEGITASELSRITNIDRSVLHKIITGATKNPSIDSIKPIIEHYSFEEVILGVNKTKDSTWRLPIISWHEATVYKNIDLKTNQRKYINLGFKPPTNSFCLLIEHTIDSRFPKDTILVVDQNKEPKNLSFLIIQEADNELATLKRFILDGTIPYLKSIDHSIPSVKYESKKIKIIGTVILSIFHHE